MDGNSFDQASRLLARRIGRRSALAGLFGLAAGAVGIESARAADSRRTFCRTPGHKCKRNAECCSGFCDTRITRHRTRLNSCACPADTTLCGSRCVDTTNDIANCGGCGIDCDPTIADSCWDGECHCNEGPACTEGATCENGECVKPIIPLATGNCDTDLSPDVPYCVRNQDGEDWLALCPASDFPSGQQAVADLVCQTDAQCANLFPVCGMTGVRCDCLVGVQPFGKPYVDFSVLIGSTQISAPTGSGICFAYTANPELCAPEV